MALTQFTENVDNIQELDNNPNVAGLTAAELKARFDKAGSDIKTYINDTLIDELDTKFSSVDSGIAEIGTLSNLETTTKTDAVSAINELYDEMFYKAGDTIGATTYQIGGYITSSRTQLYFTIYTRKSLKNINTVTVSGGTFSIRTTNSGYLNNGDFAYNASGMTTEAYKTSDHTITVRVTKSSAFANVNNNTPIGGAASGLTLNLS